MKMLHPPEINIELIEPEKYKFQNPFTLRLRLLCDSKASSPRLVSFCAFFYDSVTKMASLHSFFISKIIKLPSLGIQSPCQMMIRVYNHLLSIVFRFHYRSQKVIGSLGHVVVGKNLVLKVSDTIEDMARFQVYTES